jgi:hypothetical protein
MADPQNPGEKIYPTVILPATETVSDPATGDPVELGYISNFRGKAPVLGSLVFRPSNQGRIVLHGSRAEDRDMYVRLKLSDMNESNTNRNTSVPAYFYEVDESAEILAKKTKRDAVFNALDLAKKMKKEEILEFLAARAIPAPQKTDLETLRAIVEEVVEKDPEGFIKTLRSETTPVRALIANAIKAEVIRFDRTTNQFVWNDTLSTIFAAPASSPVTPEELFAAHLLTEKLVLEEIEKLTKAKS